MTVVRCSVFGVAVAIGSVRFVVAVLQCSLLACCGCVLQCSPTRPVAVPHLLWLTKTNDDAASQHREAKLQPEKVQDEMK